MEHRHYYNADSYHILTSTQAKETTTDHYTRARRIFPSAVQDPSYSTRLHCNLLPGCDSSFWRFPRFRLHTCDPQWSGVRADTEMTTTGTVCRSLLPLYGRHIHVLTLKDCNLRAVHSIITAYQNYYVALRRLAFPLGCITWQVTFISWVRRRAGSTGGGGAYSMRLTNFCMSVFLQLDARKVSGS